MLSYAILGVTRCPVTSKPVVLFLTFQPRLTRVCFLQSGAVEGQEVAAAVAPLAGELHEEQRAADSVVGAAGEAGLEPLAVAREGLVVETEADAGGVDSAAEAGAGVEDVAGDHTKRLRENDAGFAPCPNVFCVYSGGCNIFCANDPCILGWEPRRKMAVNDRQIVN
ncbi:hypothetical protein BOTBODRAFT_421069 [Botryobasidium botryosum FD-172 SS1]|uniref:Uncharacterized protein n=1 Tax=Botryobasidium botryosum (strain FD-172 SS1) TaxID=930990 RepID=A0A067M9V6_BOTB1|nr:hypothetical protein BOTBODRAFT_421069 [Botryobasidium botryosum FD-172 SS1]